MTSRCRQLGRRWFSILFGLLGLAGLVGYVAGYPAELSRVQGLAVGDIATLSLLVIASHLLTAIKLRLSATMFGIELPYWEAWMMLESGSLINIIPMSATGFRAVYLKKVHGMKYVNFGLGTLAIIVTNFVSSGVLGIVGLLVLVWGGQVGISALLFLLFAAYVLGPFLVLGVAWWFRRRGARNLDRAPANVDLRWWDRVYRSLIAGLEAILTQPRVVVQFFVLNLLTSLAVCVRFWLVGVWLGYPVDLASGLVLQGTSQATNLITVLPSGIIGLREAFTGLGAAGLGGSAISGVMIAAIDRVVAMTWIIVLGGISLVVLYNRIARAEAARRTSEPDELAKST